MAGRFASFTAVKAANWAGSGVPIVWAGLLALGAALGGRRCPMKATEVRKDVVEASGVIAISRMLMLRATSTPTRATLTAVRRAPGRVRRFFGGLGPGLITGAADDDPSGISTYSVTGAAFGFTQLWTVFFAFPLMAAVQIMCARLGLVSGQGLAGVLRRRYPKWVLFGACTLLAVANTVNIGADLGGMAQAMQMMTGL